MAFREVDRIPDDEEFTTTELPITSTILRAAGLYLGKYCDEECKEYMLCNSEEKSPVKCLKEGKKVTECGMKFLQKLKVGCAIEFDEFHNCVEKNTTDFAFYPCRKYQGLLDKCVQEKLNVARPEIGYFSRVRKHKTDRPKPEVTDPYPYHETSETLPTLKEKKPETDGFPKHNFN